MKYKIFSIRDRAIDSFGQPFYAPTVGGAIRSFSDEINRAAENNQLYKHSEDYDLYSLGEFDDQSGEFTTSKPSQVAVGKDLIIKA